AGTRPSICGTIRHAHSSSNAGWLNLFLHKRRYIMGNISRWHGDVFEYAERIMLGPVPAYEDWPLEGDPILSPKDVAGLPIGEIECFE
ncbi:MAG: hypothetical protein KDA66_06910, partial [Planctomycetaceae bacterium]|nr:hypothetical protein [Planctomycetaceae bacterium]